MSNQINGSILRAEATCRHLLVCDTIAFSRL
jgi:hypothetical protein